MIVRRRLVPRALISALTVIAAMVVVAPAMAKPPAGGLEWGVCADPDATAAGWECATYTAPKDYDHPRAGSVKIAVTRLPATDQANRVGPLFVNPGGPGGSAVDFAQGNADLFAAFNDRYFTIGAIEQKYTSDIQTYLTAGDNSWGMFDHFWFNSGYVEVNYGLWPIHDKDAYSGPFTASKSAPTVLEVATTYDPATPFRGAKRLVPQLGNVRFLTMVGDGHTAFGGNSACIDDYVVAYVQTLALSPKGAVCKQEVPIVPPPAPAASAKLAMVTAAGGTAAERLMRLHVRR